MLMPFYSWCLLWSFDLHGNHNIQLTTRCWEHRELQGWNLHYMVFYYFISLHVICFLYCWISCVFIDTDANIYEGIKKVIRIRKTKKNRQKKKDKRTNNDLQNITQKIKDRVTRIPLKTGGTQVLRNI